jgi:hypothetical protein
MKLLYTVFFQRWNRPNPGYKKSRISIKSYAAFLFLTRTLRNLYDYPILFPFGCQGKDAAPVTLHPGAARRFG